MATGEISLGIKDIIQRQNGPQRLRALPFANDVSRNPQASTARKPAKRKKPGNLETSPERIARLEKRRAAKRRKEEEINQPTIIVAIDLGCTFTGVAFVAAGYHGNQVQVLNEWPGGSRNEKTPTRIAYQDENDNLSKDRFGYEIRPGMKSYGWFKLQLDRNTEPSEFDDPLLQRSAGLGIEDLPPGKDVVDVVADYLTFVSNETFAFLQARLGDIMVKETAKIFCLTTPAVWSYPAREMTRKAAAMAGLGTRWNTLCVKDKLQILDEPEAAAIAAIKTTLDELPRTNPFKKDQGIILADLGGGTADLVSYKIVSLYPLELEELCIGIGGKCGGTSVDRALYALMEKRYNNAFTSLPATKTGQGSKFMDMFETCKHIFTSEDRSRTWEMTLKMPQLDKSATQPFQYDVEEDMVVLSCEDMESLFDVAVENSLALVSEQIRLINKANVPPAEAIILCGGLGSSPYIKSRFQDYCERASPKLRVIQPLHPWSAVCRGAALRGLEDSPILSRRSRASYGFMANEAFRAGEHDEADAFEDKVFGKRAKNQMCWPVEKNEKLKPGEPKTRACQYTVPPGYTELLQHENLYRCTKDRPPTRINSSVHKVGIISIDLTNHLIDERRKATRNKTFNVDEKAIVIDFEIVYAIGTDKGVMEVSAFSNKREVGKASIDWEANSDWQQSKQVKLEGDR